jgi:hypothetical protein
MVRPQDFNALLAAPLTFETLNRAKRAELQPVGTFVLAHDDLARPGTTPVAQHGIVDVVELVGFSRNPRKVGR